MAIIGTQVESTIAHTMRLNSARSSPRSTPTRVSTPQLSTRKFPSNATIVLVGSRGSGKRSLGFIGATHLGRRLITEDHYFEEVTGISRREFLSRYGVKEFGKRNVELLQRMLDDNPTNCVIECGMGSLAREAQATLREYSKSHPVIYILRNPNRIRKLLNLSESESKRLEFADSVHSSCSNFEYYNIHDPSCENHLAETSQDRASPNYSSGLKDAKQDFSRFLDFVTGYGIEKSAFESPFSLAAIAPENRPYTYALSIRLSDLMNGNVDLPELDCGDAVELRIDTRVPNILSVLDKQIAKIRRKLSIPIIFHVEEGGPEREESTLALLQHGLRLGVEYLVMPLELSDQAFVQIMQAKGWTKVIGHHQARQPGTSGWLDASRMALYNRAQWLGCDLVRIVQPALSKNDNNDARVFANQISALPMPRPLLIAYNQGTLGHPSLLSNQIFTPVTHGAIKNNPNNPPDFLITAQEAMQALYQTSVLDPLHFYIFGGAVFYSLSPRMHNAAYRICGMSHDFHTRQATSIEELHQLSLDPHFGGAGIAQPFKVELMSHIQAMSHHVKAIGATNTVLPLRAPTNGTMQSLLNEANRRNHAGPVCGWYGGNTDWIGIVTCLRRNVSPRNVVQPSRTTGLVIGAGGMARAAIYAMIQLGCRKIFIYNRTIANAETVANHFNSWAGALSEQGNVVTVLKSRDEPWPTGYKPPTLIVSCVPAHSVGSAPAADFEMPPQWLGSPTGGVVLEVRQWPISASKLLSEFVLTAVHFSVGLQTP